MTHIPDQLLRSLEGVAGFDREGFEEVHRHGGKVVSLRYNPSKSVFSGDHDEKIKDLQKVPWSSEGYYLPARPSFTLDPLLHAGAYYVQEASSMFLEQAVTQTMDLSRSLKVLDLCAAPGGKSTVLQSLISGSSVLVSNEVIKSRVAALVENLTKWGGPNMIVTNNDPKDFNRLEGFFDLVVVDAPCSGSGLFRRDPGAVTEWSPESVEACSLRQQRILADAYPCLKENGTLIYCTCSYSAEENEAICDWLMDEFKLSSLSLNTPASWHITETRSARSGSYGYRFFPDQLKGEGFFLACFTKQDGAAEHHPSRKKSKLVRVKKSEAGIVSPWLEEPDASVLFHHNDEVFAFPSALEADLININVNLYTKKAGVSAGKILHGELVPAHDLAVSTIVNRRLPAVSLNLEDALQYLRKDEVKIETEAKGWILVQFEGLNLGWIKMLKARINNYYPREWRILKSGNN